MEQDRKMTDYIVDAETGEITGNLYEGDKIVRPKHNNDNIIENYNTDKKFIKLYVGVSDKLADILTGSESKFILRISSLICYEDYFLRRGGVHNGTKLDMQLLADEIGMNYNSVRGIVSSLKKKGVFGIFQTGEVWEEKLHNIIVVNPNIFGIGRSVDKRTLKLFEDSGWDQYLVTKKTW